MVETHGQIKPDEFLSYRLNLLAVVVSQALSRACSHPHRLDLPQWRILLTLAHFGEMTGKAVANHSHLHKTTVSRIAAELVRRGLLARRTHPDDLRETFLSLTAAGQTIYEKIAPAALEFERMLLASLNAADRQAFDRALTSLAQCAARFALQPSDRPGVAAR